MVATDYTYPLGAHYFGFSTELKVASIVLRFLPESLWTLEAKNYPLFLKKPLFGSKDFIREWREPKFSPVTSKSSLDF